MIFKCILVYIQNRFIKIDADEKYFLSADKLISVSLACEKEPHRLARGVFSR
jgi:hypothetical protein